MIQKEFLKNESVEISEENQIVFKKVKVRKTNMGSVYQILLDFVMQTAGAKPGVCNLYPTACLKVILTCKTTQD